MIDNLQRLNELAGLARKRKLAYVTKTVVLKHLEESLEDGWVVIAKSKKTVRLSKEKETLVALEDRWWTLLYRLQFTHISGPTRSNLQTNSRSAPPTSVELGTIGLNDQVALIARGLANATKRNQIENFIEEVNRHRELVARSLSEQLPVDSKRQIVYILLTQDLKLKSTERDALDAANIAILDEHDVDYYEKLTSHLGPAAQYQLLADLLPGKTIPALAIRVPAVKTKIGGVSAYTFAINPEYLLKISYVSHRSKGKASDVNTYQRMVSKGRLATIKKYISEDGVFPTNIVLNIDKNRLNFERVKQTNSKTDEQDSGTLGWLDIKPAYKSAWIIDGQHRLYAYSGHDKATHSHLSVLAFEGLSASKQAQLFIDINAKQKSVKQSLLQELYAELHWDATDPTVRVRAIVSKAIQVLDTDSSSPFRGKIQTADSVRDTNRCVSITSIFGALEKSGFFVSREKKGAVVEFGALWAGDNDSTLRRTVHVLNAWFEPIAEEASDWWKLGAAEGGGLAMNDGVSACIEVLRSVLQTPEGSSTTLVKLSEDDLLKKLEPYANALGTYLGSLNEAARKQFRDYRGIQGVTTRMRRCQQAIRDQIPTFNPNGLDEFVASEKQQTNSKAKTIIDAIESLLQRTCIEVLSGEFGEDSWWVEGVPKSVRAAASGRYEDDNGKRGGREYYFDLIDYRKIATENWSLFEGLFGYGKPSGKDKKTQWLVDVNDSRKVVAHASSGKTLSLEELEFLQNIEAWLTASINGNPAT
jgi:DGQHR domain-containing protein